jgi:hypothetical protein
LLGQKLKISNYKNQIPKELVGNLKIVLYNIEKHFE